MFKLHNNRPELSQKGTITMKCHFGGVQNKETSNRLIYIHKCLLLLGDELLLYFLAATILLLNLSVDVESVASRTHVHIVVLRG